MNYAVKAPVQSVTATTGSPNDPSRDVRQCGAAISPEGTQNDAAWSPGLRSRLNVTEVRQAWAAFQRFATGSSLPVRQIRIRSDLRSKRRVVESVVSRRIVRLWGEVGAAW
jgi:hypothetical protein